MSTYVYTMYRANKFYGPDRHVLKDISLSFLPGAKIGLLGGNGAGKSTLLRIMAGVEEPSSGVAEPAPGLHIGYLPQEPVLDSTKDVRGNVEEALLDARGLLEGFERLTARFAEPLSDDEMASLLAQQGEVQDAIERVDAWSLDRRLETAMDALRLPPGDAPVSVLSGGERRRVALCRLLLSQPQMLLLDEPTNHLDAESVAWLERFLAEYAGTVVAVTHDRYFLDNVAGWILELDRGHGIPFQGNYSAWLEAKQARFAVEDRQADARRRTLERELEWVRMSPRARHAKSRARLAAYERLLADDREARHDPTVLRIPAGPRLGDVVLEATGLGKGYGDRLLFEDLTFTLPPAGIVGVIGANGAGKTTLFRIITGSETPDTGVLCLGDTVRIAHVDQTRDALDPARSVWEEITDGRDTVELGGVGVPSRAYVASFNFRGSDQQQRVGGLSGGERNRVHLAKLLRRGGNLLLLDEPTNDLDVETLRSLEQALIDFAGCALVISHDRWFLDRIATHMLAFEGDSRVVFFEGSYAEYEQHRRAVLGADADQPHRIRYKPLVRG